MQAYLTSWIPELGPQDRSHEKMACSKPRAFMNNAYFNSLKRKRTDSYDSATGLPSLPALDTMQAQHPQQQQQHQPKKHKEETLTAPAPAAAISVAPAPVPPQPAPVVDIAIEAASEQLQTSVQNTSVSSQFSGAAHATTATDSFFPQQPPPPVAPAQDQPQGQPRGQPEDQDSTLADNQQVASMDDGLTKQERVQLKLTRELDLEILLKHKELRLIEQELAKCQVSYEQLRRCRVVPYPGQPGSTTTPSQIAYEGGAAVESPRGYTSPQYPAPWGFADGPYTQHYARWLIPDPSFDSMPTTRMSSLSKSFSAMESRSNRMGGLDRTSFSASRAHRASVGNGFQSLSGNYPVHKEKHGPLIVKRPSDGQWVKLVCKFCGKENISSVQGFLNHCRIAHDKNYESHTAAVDDSAQPLGPDEAPPLSTPVNEQPPPHSAVPSVVSTPTPTVVTAPALPTPSLPRVHPLINNPQKPKVTAATQCTVSTPIRETPPSSATKVKAPLTFQNLDAGSFKAAMSTPKLSLLLKSRGVSGNLEQLVSSSKEQIDIDEISYIHADSDASAAASPTAASGPAAIQSRKPKVSVGGRMPASGQPASKRAKTVSTSLLQSEPNSPLTPSMTASPHYSRFPSGLSQETIRPADIDIPHSPMQVDDELSPHTNPGLVTDRGEDDDESDSQSRSGSERDGHSAADMRVRIRQDDERYDPMALDESQDHGVCSLQSPVAPVQPVAAAAAAQSAPPPAVEKRKRGRPSKKDAAARK